MLLLKLLRDSWRRRSSKAGRSPPPPPPPNTPLPALRRGLLRQQPQALLLQADRVTAPLDQVVETRSRASLISDMERVGGAERWTKRLLLLLLEGRRLLLRKLLLLLLLVGRPLHLLLHLRLLLLLLLLPDLRSRRSRPRSDGGGVRGGEHGVDVLVLESVVVVAEAEAAVAAGSKDAERELPRSRAVTSAFRRCALLLLLLLSWRRRRRRRRGRLRAGRRRRLPVLRCGCRCFVRLDLLDESSRGLGERHGRRSQGQRLQGVLHLCG